MNNILTLIIIPLFTGLISISYYKSQSFNLEDYERVTSLLNNLRQTESSQLLKLSELKNYQEFNYDEIDGLLDREDKLFNQIIVELYSRDSVDIKAGIQKVNQLKVARRNLVDEFKVSNSLFKNSFQQLPILIFRTLKKAEGNNKLTLVLNNIITDLQRFIYSNDQSNSRQLESLIKILDTEKEMTRNVSEHVKLISLHLSKIIETSIIIEGILLDLKLPVYQEQIAELENSFRKLADKQIATSLIYQKILYMSLIFLILFILFFIFTLNSTKGYLNSILGAIVDPLFLIDPNGRIVTYNNKASAFIGLNRENTPIKEIIPNLSEVVEGDNNEISLHEASLLTQDNIELPVSVSAAEIETSNVKSPKVILAKDISELKNAEKERVLLLDKLGSNSRMAVIGEMAGRAAHEVLNPLTALNVRTELRKEEEQSIESDYEESIENILQKLTSDQQLEGNEKKVLEEYLASCLSFFRDGELFYETFEASLKRVYETVNSMRSFSEVRSKGDKLGMKHLIDSFTQLKSEYCTDRQIELNICEFEEINIIADEANILQVLSSLVDNSAEVFEARNIIDPFIKIDISSHDDTIIMTFEDNGGGLRMSDPELIFEAGVSGDENSLSAGLGLSICRRLLRSMGGDITIEKNDVNRGVSFKITLKRA